MKSNDRCQRLIDYDYAILAGNDTDCIHVHSGKIPQNLLSGTKENLILAVFSSQNRFEGTGA